MKVVPVFSVAIASVGVSISMASFAQTSPLPMAQTDPQQTVEEDYADEPTNQPANDPWERLNRKVFNFNQTLDRYALEPVARGYVKITPAPVQGGVSNFFSNLGELPNIANHLFQLKPHKAVQSTARLVINSTAGLFGMVDVASRLGISAQKTDLGQTLGYWGVGSGQYVVLPVLGPSSVRDGLSTVVQLQTLNPLDLAQTDTQQTALTASNLVSTRAELLPATDLLNRVALDPYLASRDAFLANRQSRIESLKDEDLP